MDSNGDTEDSELPHDLPSNDKYNRPQLIVKQEQERNELK